MCSKECKDKLKRIEELVEADVTNGRAIQKKVRAKLTKNGIKPEKLIKTLQSSKSKD
jgi:hypothetical protein